MERTLDPLPKQMLNLPVDERGYPVPWFVEWIDGKPEFRAVDRAKLRAALVERRCWVCGGTLGNYKVFVNGPMCGINRIASEPPSHYDCALWSAKNCPFLSNPRQVRREDDLLNNEKLAVDTVGIHLSRNPGVAMLWVTRSFEIMPQRTIRALGGNPGTLLIMGEPERVEWYYEARPATRREVLKSIAGGWPALLATADTEWAQKELSRERQEFEATHLPPPEEAGH